MVKRKGNLISSLCRMDNILLADTNARKNYQISPVESRGIDFVGYAFRHDYIRVRKGIKNSCRKRIRHSNNLAGILPSYFGWFQHCNAVNLKRTILDEVRKIENK